MDMKKAQEGRSKKGLTEDLSLAFDGGKIIYECDPQKNTECDKSDCLINGGVCFMTNKAEYSKEGATAINSRDIKTYEEIEKSALMVKSTDNGNAKKGQGPFDLGISLEYRHWPKQHL